mmetsp:Transcript_9101/g.32160  ORF Transcript_9101/g.32160 Transcript_9101/m.32160 type:complete len:216 (-) Transcript_9101:6-653(-)
MRGRPTTTLPNGPGHRLLSTTKLAPPRRRMMLRESAPAAAPAPSPPPPAARRCRTDACGASLSSLAGASRTTDTAWRRSWGTSCGSRGMPRRPCAASASWRRGRPRRVPSCTARRTLTRTTTIRRTPSALRRTALRRRPPRSVASLARCICGARRLRLTARKALDGWEAGRSGRERGVKLCCQRRLLSRPKRGRRSGRCASSSRNHNAGGLLIPE